MLGVLLICVDGGLAVDAENLPETPLKADGMVAQPRLGVKEPRALGSVLSFYSLSNSKASSWTAPSPVAVPQAWPERMNGVCSPRRRERTLLWRSASVLGRRRS